MKIHVVSIFYKMKKFSHKKILKDILCSKCDRVTNNFADLFRHKRKIKSSTIKKYMKEH